MVEATTAEIAAALEAALAMAAVRPKADLEAVELGSSAEPLLPWNISREEF